MIKKVRMKTNAHSIYLTLAFIITSIIVLVISIDTANEFISTKKLIVADMKQNSKSDIQLLQKNLSALLESYSESEYENIILSEIEQRDYFAIILEDYNMGAILGEKAHIVGKVKYKANIIKDYETLNQKQQKEIKESFYSVEENITSANGKIIGKISLYITDEKINKKLKELLTHNFINTIIISFLLILALFFMIKNFIFEHITNMVQIIENHDGYGLPSESIPLSGPSEVVILSETLNSMVQTVRNSRNILNNLNKTLELKVKKRTNELENSLDTLEKAQEKLVVTEKMASLGSLVAGVAHEINTPIGLSLTGSTHLHELTKNMQTMINEKTLKQSTLEQYLYDVEQITNAMTTSLTNAANIIRSFKQVAVDQHSEQIRNFNLHDYVTDTLLSLHNHTKYTAINIENLIDKGLSITSYPGIFSQIITNFVTNSITHAYDKGQKGNVKIKSTINNDNLELLYSDDGKGMNEKVVKHVFDPFYTTKLGQGGSGLGMHIVYNLVTMKLHGTIECRSTLGQGTEFKIVIPMEQLLQENRSNNLLDRTKSI